MSPIGIGAHGKAGILKEASYGNGGEADTFLELRAEDSMKNEITKIPGDFLTGSPTLYKYYHGVQDPKGGIPIVVNPDNIGLLLFMALGAEAGAAQVNTTEAEVTDYTCEADVAGSLSGEYILLNDPTTEYYAWFDIDDKGSVDPAIAGKTGIIVAAPVGDLDTATKVATAVAAAIDNEGDFGAGSAGAVVTVTNANDGAVADGTNGDTGWSVSPNVTTEGSGGAAYDHVFTPANAATDLGSFAYWIERDIDCFIYKGCTVNSMAFKATKGSLLYADFDVLAKSETDGQTFPGISASTKKPYTFKMGQVKINGSGVAYVNSFDFTHSWNLDADGGFVLDGNDTRAHSFKTIETLTGSMGLEWTAASDTLRDAYLDNTQKKLELIFTSTEEVESGLYYTLSIEIPVVSILGDPPVIGGRERIGFTVNFEGVYDSTNFVKITHRDARTTKWSTV